MVRAMLEIQRFDPGRGVRPYPQRFAVELADGSTVLEALMAVQEYQDGSLAFRRACRHGICGACAMRINGCSRLACNTQLADVVEQAARMAERKAGSGHGPAGDPADGGVGAASRDEAAVTVAPLANMPVVKDLVTDMEVFWRKIRRVRPWLEPTEAAADPDRERLMTPGEWDEVAQAVLCLECGACYSACESLAASPEFIGPTALALAHRFVADPRDDAARERLAELSDEHGLRECTRCFYCTQHCPKHIPVRELITELGGLAYDERLRDDAAVRHAQAFVASLKESGRLNEARLGVRTQGLAWTVRHAAHIARQARAGKLASPRPAAIDEHDKLKELVERAEDGP
jgi:succinate dehydrogenase / fumarate reductase iron-sulfur subunit